MSEQKRFALVIGNESYPRGKLSCCRKDAREMSVALSRLGFEVDEQYDLLYSGMRDSFQSFVDNTFKQDADACLVYYSGHGCSIDGMIGLGTIGENEPPFPLDALLSALPESIVKILILDTCRTDYYSGNPAIQHVFTVNPNYKHSKNTFMAFATGLFSPAMAGGQEPWALSPFTNEVLKWIERPGMEIDEMFKEIRISLHRVMDGKQIPWINSSLIDDFYFIDPENGKDPLYNPLKEFLHTGDTNGSKLVSNNTGFLPPDTARQLSERTNSSLLVCSFCKAEFLLKNSTILEEDSDSLFVQCPYCRSTIKVSTR